MFRKWLMQNCHTRKSNIMQSHEVHMPFQIRHLEQNIETIYQIGSLGFKTAFLLKVHEETVSVHEQVQNIPLLSKFLFKNISEKDIGMSFLV